MTKDNTILGSFVLDGIPPKPAGEDTFQVIFDLDTNGILNVTAVHDGSGKQNSITIDAHTSGRLTEQDIKMLVEQKNSVQPTTLNEKV